MVFPGRAEVDLDLRHGGARLVLPPLLRLPARPQHLQPARAGRDPQDHGLLDPARRLGLSHGRGAVRDRHQGPAGRRSRSSSTTCCARCASSCSGGRATAIILAEANVLPETDMEYFGEDGDRMHMMFNFQVNQNLFYALAAADIAPAGQGAQGHQAAARDRAVGPVPAQSRRARSRPADRRAAPARSSQRFGPEHEHAALRSRHPAAARADAGRRSAAHRAGLQPDVHAARARR